MQIPSNLFSPNLASSRLQSTDGMEVVLSGSVITFGPFPANVELSVAGLLFRFELSIDGGEPSVSGEGSGSVKYVISIKNFKNVLPTSLINPLEVGKVNGRKLFTNFAVVQLGENSPAIFYYTFYLGQVQLGVL